MSSSVEFIEFVCEQLRGAGDVSYRKMFGEYMVYADAKPLLLVCEDTPYVKMHPCLSEIMKDAESGIPYEGAKPHYILDIDDRERALTVVEMLKEVTPLPKPKKRKL